jgi:hypothetical protein
MSLARRRTAPLIALAVLSLLAAYLAVPPGRAGAATGGTANAALGRPAAASSTENASFGAGNAVDGNPGTRWSSAFSDPQWLQVDLGTSSTVCGVTPSWETAFARSFQVQVAPAATGPFTTIFSTTTGTGDPQWLLVAVGF